MEKNNFFYSERLLGFRSDNEIIYYAGPVKIEISGWSGFITLSSKKKWEYLLKECLLIAKEAWEVLEEQISYEYEDNMAKIKIQYNFQNLKLYIEHSIIFM